jgi:hypothetical protein
MPLLLCPRLIVESGPDDQTLITMRLFISDKPGLHVPLTLYHVVQSVLGNRYLNYLKKKIGQHGLLLKEKASRPRINVHDKRYVSSKIERIILLFLSSISMKLRRMDSTL